MLWKCDDLNRKSMLMDHLSAIIWHENDIDETRKHTKVKIWTCWPSTNGLWNKKGLNICTKWRIQSRSKGPLKPKKLNKWKVGTCQDNTDVKNEWENPSRINESLFMMFSIDWSKKCPAGPRCTFGQGKTSIQEPSKLGFQWKTNNSLRINSFSMENQTKI